MKMLACKWFLSLAVAFSMALTPAFGASRIKDVASLQAGRDNQLIGYGLVVGLQGTGDSLRSSPFTDQSIRAMLQNLGISTQGGESRTRNVAAVLVTANLPPFASPGSRVDVTVGSLGDSTSLRGGFGGNAGRPLAKGDRIAVGEDAEIAMLPASGLAVVEPAVALRDVFPAPVDGALTIRALPAGEHDLFAGDGEAFWSQTWRISSRSDRTGYRLSGEPIKPTASIEMRSHGVVPGVIQVPPGGEPIVQMSDANTAGGYPKIAGVIECDLWRLGQARIGARLSFVRSTHAEARRVEQAVARYVDDVRQTCRMVKRALKAMA